MNDGFENWVEFSGHAIRRYAVVTVGPVQETWNNLKFEVSVITDIPDVVITAVFDSVEAAKEERDSLLSQLGAKQYD